MKNGISLFSIILLLFISIQSFAQIRFGVRAGLNLATMTVVDLGDAKQEMSPSFHIGGIAEYSLSESFCIESGLLLSGKGSKIVFSENQGGVTFAGTATISPLYLEIPINALYKFDIGSSRLHLFAGPYLGFGIAGKTKATYTASGLPTGTTLSSLGLNDASANIKFGTTADSDMKGSDFGLNIGAGIEIKNILFRLQYGLGLSNLDPEGLSDKDFKNRVIGISVGYLFGGE